MQGRINERGRTHICALCDEKTNEFIKAHIPRCGKATYWVHPDCEMVLNYFVSIYDQERLTLKNAKWIVENRVEIKQDSNKLLHYAVDNYKQK